MCTTKIEDYCILSSNNIDSLNEYIKQFLDEDYTIFSELQTTNPKGSCYSLYIQPMVRYKQKEE